MTDLCELCRHDTLEPVYEPEGSTRGLKVHLCGHCGLVQSMPRIDRARARASRGFRGADWGNVRYGKGFRTKAGTRRADAPCRSFTRRHFAARCRLQPRQLRARVSRRRAGRRRSSRSNPTSAWRRLAPVSTAPNWCARASRMRRSKPAASTSFIPATRSNIWPTRRACWPIIGAR